jgi:sortase A
MTIPAFGRGWKFAIVQGTGLSQLALGPGHIPGTSWPGGTNFGVAAHDITAGNPFMHLGSLRTASHIYVRTRGCLFDYQVTGHPFKVRYTDVAVLRTESGKHLITLVTCTPMTLAFTDWRIIVHAQLVSAREVRGGPLSRALPTGTPASIDTAALYRPYPGAPAVKQVLSRLTGLQPTAPW